MILTINLGKFRLPPASWLLSKIVSKCVRAEAASVASEWRRREVSDPGPFSPLTALSLVASPCPLHHWVSCWCLMPKMVAGTSWCILPWPRNSLVSLAESAPPSCSLRPCHYSPPAHSPLRAPGKHLGISPRSALELHHLPCDLRHYNAGKWNSSSLLPTLRREPQVHCWGSRQCRVYLAEWSSLLLTLSPPIYSFSIFLPKKVLPEERGVVVLHSDCSAFFLKCYNPPWPDQ